MARYWVIGPALLLGGLLGSEAAVSARPHGGGGGGGRGGVAVGGARVGGFRVGGVSAAGFRVGGVNAAGFRVGGVRGAVVGVNAFGRPLARFYPYRRYYPGFYGGWWPWGWGWGGYPLAGGYDYAPDYGYLEPAAITSAGYYSPPTPDFMAQAEPAPQQQPGDDTAHLMVNVAENAQLWFDGSLTRQTGTQREFVTPPLAPGKNYIYDLLARWTQDGRPYEAKRTVYVHANDWLQIDLTRATTLPRLPRP